MLNQSLDNLQETKSAKSKAADEEEDDSELFGEDFAVGYVKSLLRI